MKDHSFQSYGPLAVSVTNPDGDNQELTADECDVIRALPDFDLTMLISQTHDGGWTGERNLCGRDFLATVAQSVLAEALQQIFNRGTHRSVAGMTLAQWMRDEWRGL